MEYYYSMPDNQMLDDRAPLIKRALAFMIDLVSYNILFQPVFMTAFQATSKLSDELLTTTYLLKHPEIMSAMTGVMIASTVIFGVYMALSEHLLGRTLGKQLMGLHLKGRNNLWGLIARNLLKSTLIILLPIDLLGLLYSKDRLIDKYLNIKVMHSKSISLTEELIKP